MNDHHNPAIEVIEPGKRLNFKKEEVLIKRLHFIWLGSPLTIENAKNLPKWVAINDGCDYQIYIWYDSMMLTEQGIETMLKFIEYLNTALAVTSDQLVFLCDVRHYPLFDDEFIYDAYQYELGLVPRPGINPLASEIKNYGLSTDVLRMCILKLYGGFYMDLDMTPTRLCKYHHKDRIKSCPLRFCIALSEKPAELDVSEEEAEAYHNMYNDYDNYYDYRAQYDINELESEYPYEASLESGMINNGLYYDPSVDYREGRYIDLYFSKFKYNYTRIIKHHYYPYFLDYRTVTIYASGPDIFVKLFTRFNAMYPQLSAHKAILRDIVEDPAQSTHSWITIAKHKDVLAVLMYELFQDEELIDLTYNFSIKGEEIYDDESTEGMVGMILDKYISIFNSEAVLMYGNTESYREELIEKLTNYILSDHPPGVGLYIDLADLIIDAPGPYIRLFQKGNYTKEERILVDAKFKEYIEPFMAKYDLIS